MTTKDSIMKQSIFFWVFGHRLSFEYGLKKFLFGAWRNLSGALRELILMFQCTEHIEMNKFLCSLASTWMTIIDSQFYIIDS